MGANSIGSSGFSKGTSRRRQETTMQSAGSVSTALTKFYKGLNLEMFLREAIELTGIKSITITGNKAMFELEGTLKKQLENKGWPALEKFKEGIYKIRNVVGATAGLRLHDGSIRYIGLSDLLKEREYDEVLRFTLSKIESLSVADCSGWNKKKEEEIKKLIEKAFD